MFTYIINTSENKTFDCDNLIRLVKYNKIQWIYARLDKIEEVAKEIYERQNTLDAEEFRIVVLIDFFGFDRVRKPYSKADYAIENGVDVNLYIPFIQTYIFDHLFNYLENKDLWAYSWDIYYIQNEKYEHFDLLDNSDEQIVKVISPVEDSKGITLPEDFYQDSYIEDKKYIEVLEKEITELRSKIKKLENDSVKLAEYKVVSKELRHKEKEYLDLQKKIEKEYETERICYGEYELYCTHNYSLHFNLNSYPYNSFVKSHDVEITDQNIEDDFNKLIEYTKKFGAPEDVNRYNQNKEDTCERLRFEANKKLTLSEFYSAFKDRVNLHKYRVNSHFYVIGYSSSPAKSAFDALSLSLYLIRAFEREEENVSFDLSLDADITDINSRNKDEKNIKLNQKVLVDSLVKSWNKINSAREVAKKANITYYNLLSVPKNSIANSYLDKPLTDEYLIEKECEKEVDTKIEKKEIKIPNDADALVNCIHDFGVRKAGLAFNEQAGFNDIFNKYTNSRDKLDQSSLEEAFKINHKGYETQSQCPSKSVFDQADDLEKQKISSLFQRALQGGYVASDYTQEKDMAMNQYQEYKNHEKELKGKRGQIGILFIAVLIMMIPYIFITTELDQAFTLAKVLLYLKTLAAIVALYIAIYFIKISPIKKELDLAKEKLKFCYRRCLIKQARSLYGYKRMYEEDLVLIEKVRYERRDLLKLYQYNQKLNDNVEQHRKQLEKMEESLSTMLNNLGISPVVDINESSVEGEFNLEKSINSPENNIYKVFSLETIDRLFETSWEDE